jgi:hypothetical protein
VSGSGQAGAEAGLWVCGCQASAERAALEVESERARLGLSSVLSWVACLAMALEKVGGRLGPGGDEDAEGDPDSEGDALGLGLGLGLAEAPEHALAHVRQVRQQAKRHGAQGRAGASLWLSGGCVVVVMSAARVRVRDAGRAGLVVGGGAGAGAGAGAGPTPGRMQARRRRRTRQARAGTTPHH